MHVADVIDDLISRVPVSTVLDYVARACIDRAHSLKNRQPASTARERATAYLRVARVVRSCARRVKRENMVGF